MRRVLQAAIRTYQRHVSPHKGFCCAYRAHTGRASCSALGYRAVRRHGVFAGLGLIRRRTRLCGVVHRRFGGVSHTHLHAQRGVCDLGCDLPCDAACDLPSFGDVSGFCDVISCCDCGGCDWPFHQRKRRDEEKYVYIPPRVGSRVEPQSNRPPRGDA